MGIIMVTMGTAIVTVTNSAPTASSHSQTKAARNLVNRALNWKRNMRMAQIAALTSQDYFFGKHPRLIDYYNWAQKQNTHDALQGESQFYQDYLNSLNFNLRNPITDRHFSSAQYNPYDPSTWWLTKQTALTSAKLKPSARGQQNFRCSLYYPQEYCKLLFPPDDSKKTTITRDNMLQDLKTHLNTVLLNTEE